MNQTKNTAENISQVFAQIEKATKSDNRHDDRTDRVLDGIITKLAPKFAKFPLPLQRKIIVHIALILIGISITVATSYVTYAISIHILAPALIALPSVITEVFDHIWNW